MRALLFASRTRQEAFRTAFENRGVSVDDATFDTNAWHDLDFEQYDFLLYYPYFEFESSHPNAIYRASDNIRAIQRFNPRMVVYPDPNGCAYYNDKYRQHLLLHRSDIPSIPTLALTSEAAIDEAVERFGLPMVVKNRYGAGGDFVFQCTTRKQLEDAWRQSALDLATFDGARRALRWMASRDYWWSLLRRRRMRYPFLSYPLIAQPFIEHQRDLKTVVFGDRLVEGHWRRKSGGDMWKVNIDGGGIGEWSFIDQEAQDVSIRLARTIECNWLNVDLMETRDGFLVSEFSPVWHHYAYREKPSFVYKDDYNIDVPLEQALDLEPLLVDSMIELAGARTTAGTS